MKIIIRSFLISVFAICVLSSTLVAQQICDPTAVPFGGGSGTSEADPYLICSVAQLQSLHFHLERTEYFKLMSDISLVGVSFDPIGSQAYAFAGTFDGNNFVIDGWSHYGPYSDMYIGFFASFGGKLKNLGLTNVSSIGFVRVGGLAGFNFGMISNSYVTGLVSGEFLGGGLIGENTGWIYQSYTSATVEGTGGIGGLVGENQGHIQECFTTGLVTRSDRVDNRAEYGGLVGINLDDGALIEDSYSTATVEAFSLSGGLVGMMYTTAAVKNSYFAGKIIPQTSQPAGGLIGANTDPGYIVRDSFWDVNASGSKTSLAGSGKTTAEMKTAATYPDTWSRNVWTIRDGDYPLLSWMSDLKAKFSSDGDGFLISWYAPEVGASYDIEYSLDLKSWNRLNVALPVSTKIHQFYQHRMGRVSSSAKNFFRVVKNSL